ncbi:dihydropteroate synthase [bacterium]|nr:dihydropteroate synthase [bacterium]
MILIGENIHVISKKVREALQNRDEIFVKNLINFQKKMDYIDLNVGPAKGDLAGVLGWVSGLVESENFSKISLDTTNFFEMKNAVSNLEKNEKVFLNSVGFDEEKLDLMTDLALENNSNLVALTMSKNSGIPKTSDGRLEIAFQIYEKCLEKGMESESIYFDPLVLPLKVDQSQAVEALNTLKMIKESFDPPVRTIIGLSNISNGVPTDLRPLINRVFGVMAFGAGLDAVIMDAGDEELIRVFRMLEKSSPEKDIDNLYLQIAKMIENFEGLDAINYDDLDVEQVRVFKTCEVLLGEKIYSDSFAQV